MNLRRVWAILGLGLALAGQAAAQEPPTLPQPAPGAEDAEREARRLNDRITLILPRLTHSRYSVRATAAQELKALPKAADALLVARLEKLNVRQQLLMIDVLCSRQAPGTPGAVFKILPGLPVTSDELVYQALRRFGDQAWEALRDSLWGEAGSPAPAGRHPRLELFFKAMVRREVLQLFKDQLATGARTGYYAEMFAPTFRYGDHTVEILGQILRQNEEVRGEFDGLSAMMAQILAARALGETGRPKAKEVLLAALKDMGSNQQGGMGLRATPQEACAFALYVLGEKKEAQNYIKALQDRVNASAGPSKARPLVELADAYTSVKEYDLALAAFEEAIALMARQGRRPNNFTDELSLAYYNCACVLSRMKQIDRGMERLKQAVAAGFDNLSWMWRDRDLANLWPTDAFKAWADELRKDEKFAKRVPKWEPGNPPPGYDPRNDEDPPAEDNNQEH